MNNMNGDFWIRDIDGQTKHITVEDGGVYETDGEGTVEEWKDYFRAMGCGVYDSSTSLAASEMGRVRSEKKARAVRENGKLGGRPRKNGGAGS
jgi:hypothetical protein